MEQKNIGIIGAGGRVLGLGRIMLYADLNLNIVSLCDKYVSRNEETRNHFSAVATDAGKASDIKLYSGYKKLIDDDFLDLVMVTTPQYFHAEPVIYALKKGKLVFCEKPLAHNMTAIKNIYDVWCECGKKNVMLGFTRRYENSWKRAKKIIDAGWIGNVRMLKLNCVIYAPNYFHKWYSENRYSGGVLNEKGAHLFDALNWFAESTPKLISAMGDRSVYTPREGYPEWCKDCDRNCEYRFEWKKISAANAKADRMAGVVSVSQKTAIGSEDILLAKDRCVYSKKVDTVDHAIANIAYENDVKAQLFLGVFGYQTEDCETLEVIGDSGKLLLERHSGIIRVHYNYGREHMTIDAKDENHHSSTIGHFGADLVIVKTINDFIRKGIEPPADVYDGYLASRMSFLATESCETNQVYEI